MVSRGNILWEKSDICRRNVSLHGRIHWNTQNSTCQNTPHTQQVAQHITNSQEMIIVPCVMAMVVAYALALYFLKLKPQKPKEDSYQRLFKLFRLLFCFS